MVRRNAGSWLAVVAALGMWPAPGRAQFAVPVQIAEVSAQIEREPRNAALYLSRGDLHRANRAWDAAQADYDQARALDPKLEVIDFVRGRMFLEAEWLVSARVALDRFLARHTNHVEALITRARTLAKLGERLAAVQDYTRALQAASEPRPEMYLERAQTLAAEGAAHVAAALEGLDEGIRRLGPLVTLELAAIDLEVGQKRYDAALARIEAAAATAPRKETWLVRKGEILEEAGRRPEAGAAYQAAARAIATLPPGRRNVPAMVELNDRIRQRIEALKSP